MGPEAYLGPTNPVPFQPHKFGGRKQAKCGSGAEPQGNGAHLCAIGGLFGVVSGMGEAG